MIEWQPIGKDPCDGKFRLYGLHVKHRTGSEWFEAHYLSFDSSGEMLEPSGDIFTDWSWNDFEVFSECPPQPTAQTQNLLKPEGQMK